MLRRFLERVVPGGLVVVLTGCGLVLGDTSPTFTPYPFVTATPAPAATLPPVTATVPPTATLPPPTARPTLRGSPVVQTIGPQETLTPLPSPSVPGVEGNCSVLPQGGFGVIFQSDPGLPPALGCPLSRNQQEAPQAWIVDTRWQPFERGEMLWAAGLGWDLNRPVVYVLYEDGTYERFDDTYREGIDPLYSGQGSPPGLLEPQGSLGKVWRVSPGLSARLGWATGPEIDELTHIQLFSNGEMLFVVPVRLTYVFKQGVPNTYLTYDVPFDR